jgi:hypothetical protein
MRKKLENCETVESSVLGFVHHAHPATAQLLDDAVMGDTLADELIFTHIFCWTPGVRRWQSQNQPRRG